jgi:hypothetical protein
MTGGLRLRGIYDGWGGYDGWGEGLLLDCRDEPDNDGLVG